MAEHRPTEDDAPDEPHRPGWRTFLKRELVLVLVVGTLLLLSVAVYLIQASESLRTLYHLP